MSDEIAVIEKEATTVLSKAREFKVMSQDDYDAAAVFIRGVKGLQKKVEETFKPIVQKAHAAWKEAKDQENKHLVPLQEAEKIVKTASITWYDEQERIRLDAERKAREEAIAAENKRRAELERQAAAHEAKGNHEKAEERRAAAEQVFVAPVVVTPTAVKAEGQSIKENWKAELTDLKALIQAVSQGHAPLNFLQADMVVINKQAKATKDSMKFDGIKFVCEKVMAVR